MQPNKWAAVPTNNIHIIYPTSGQETSPICPDKNPECLKTEDFYFVAILLFLLIWFLTCGTTIIQIVTWYKTRI